ncbi:MAG: M48 family metallopeptidase [Candidatus Levybacteria bacterium]|nr:M48 family metallopeptidase [Candidatus Levybacteria bacterium]
MPKIHIITSDRRSMSLQIAPDATLVVKAPHGVSGRQITSFVEQHQDWIEKRLHLIKKRQQFRQDGTRLFLGKTLTLHPGNYTQIKVQGDLLLFPQALLFRREKELTSWYAHQAKEIITKQVEFYAKEMKTSFRSITFSDTRSQWGRCTHDNRLQFSWRLVMAPLLVLNYVVIHELAHTIEKNHTQYFWTKVRNFNPSYRQQIKWLKDHGPKLTIE